MLVDTDVLIWHLRGYPQATRRLDQLNPLTISAVNYFEVLQGMRNKAEFIAVQTMLQRRQAVTLPVTEAITRRATELMEAMTLSYGLQMGDALIAATALEHGLPVLTGNVKHFAAMPSLLVEASPSKGICKSFATEPIVRSRFIVEQSQRMRPSVAILLRWPAFSVTWTGVRRSLRNAR